MPSKRILVTGGAGYIGAHSLVDLLQSGYEIFCVDNFSRGNLRMIKGVEKITGLAVPYEKLELTNATAVNDFFNREKFDGIVHFAAFKAVGESVQHPLLYYRNNIESLQNVLAAVIKYQIPSFIFSSSCSVYGDLNTMPVTENTILGKAQSPYGRTKQIGEELIKDVAKTCSSKFISLRYFNPAGAHPSALIGELPFGKPTNVIPAITQFAQGKQQEFSILGNDYATPDGTCVRDYIHVCDVARAHRLALQYSIENSQNEKYAVINLGSGIGTSVLEIVRAFERVSGMKLKYTMASRRLGDVAKIFASNKLAFEKLNWKPEFSLEDMIKTAWDWEKVLKV